MTEPGDLVALKAILTDIPETADRLGLLLNARLTGPAYDQTPRNCITFASTGGDGVHFSYLLAGEVPTDDSPIVMTVPMAGDPNRMVGRNLRHFLGLGRHSGYFMLEQLQYDYAGTVLALDRRELDHPAREESRALARIAEALAVEAWSEHGPELVELEEQFVGELVVTPGT